jgi:hypothetical protein
MFDGVKLVGKIEKITKSRPPIVLEFRRLCKERGMDISKVIWQHRNLWETSLFLGV